MAIGIVYGAAVVTAAVVSGILLTRDSARQALATRETLYSDEHR